jgi:hypothetical protein
VRDQLRAGLILLALVVYGIAASPLPRSMKRSQFDTPMAIEEVDQWVGILGAAGIPITRAALSDDAFAVGTVFADLRSALLGPFKGWFRITGTGQGWGLFTYPDIFPHQLVIEVRPKGGTFAPIYAGLDPDAAWMRPQLAYRRVRGVYDGNTTKPGASYDNFVHWIGRLALADFPDSAEVRVGFVRTHTTMPGVPRDPERSERFQRVVSR